MTLNAGGVGTSLMVAGEKNNLVTGGTGFVGRHVVESLRAGGERVTILSRKAGGEPDVICGDVTSVDLNFGAAQFSAVYHLAGLAHVVPRNEAEREAFYSINSRGTDNLLHALERTGRLPSAFVYVSSVSVYGRDEGELLNEETPRGARDPYGASKREAEDKVFEWCARRGVRAGVVRIPLVIGRGAPGNLRLMIEALQRGRYLGIGSGGARRSMVLAGDVARALPAVAAVGGVFHLNDGYHPSFLEIEGALARTLCHRAPRRLPLALARWGGRVGDHLSRTVFRHFPLTTRTVTKMTSTLTFSDARARREIDWRPASVLNHIQELVT